MYAQTAPLTLISAKNSEVIAYWARSSFEDLRPEWISRFPAGIARKLPNGGRVIWFGANFEDFDRDSINKAVYRPAVRQMLEWLSGSAIGGIKPWPLKYRAAFLAHGDIEDQFDLVTNSLLVFKRYGIRPTMNLLTFEAQKYPGVVKSMVKINAELAIHGDHHGHFGGTPPEDQMARLNNAIGFITRFGDRPRGLRPPELSYDSSTIDVLRRMGFEYISADNNPDQEYPRFNPNRAGSEYTGFITFPKSEMDDWDLFFRYTNITPSKMPDVMLADFNRIVDDGGLYKFNFHSQIMSRPEFIPVVDHSMRRMMEVPGVWQATLIELARWIRARNGLQVSTIASDSSLDLNITNAGLDIVEDAVYTVFPPRRVPVGRLTLAKVSKSCTFDVIDSVLYISLPRLSPGEQFSVRVEEIHTPFLQLSLYQLPVALTLLGAAFAIFLGAAAYYFFFSKHKPMHAAAESINLAAERDDLGIYGKPSTMRSTVDPAGVGTTGIRTSAAMYGSVQSAFEYPSTDELTSTATVKPGKQINATVVPTSVGSIRSTAKPASAATSPSQEMPGPFIPGEPKPDTHKSTSDWS